MLDFKSLYAILCLKHCVQKQKAVEEALVVDGHLNLSNETLSTGTCAVIGKIFETSNIISKVELDYCLLGEAGLKSILLGISSNNSITSLSLKGNAIKDEAVLEFVKLLKCNRTLTRLSLEWNNFGLNVPNFIKFCSALEFNGTLSILDLKSNQLGPEVAPHLANVIAKNSSLTFIDLSFNNIGEEGAKKILNGLKENNTLLKLSLLGNNIYDQLLNEISSQLARIGMSSMQRSNYISETEQLKHSMKLNEEIAATHIRFLEKDLTEANSATGQIIRETEQTIQSLKEELEKKNQSLEQLSTKFDIVSMTLQKEQELNQELNIKYKTSQKELSNLREIHSKFTKQADEKYRIQNQLFLTEKESMQVILSKYEIQSLEYESKWKACQTEVSDLKQKLICVESDSKALKYECEETVTKLKAEYKEILRKLEKSHSSDSKKFRLSYEEKENELKRKITALDAQNEELESDLRRAKNQLATEKENNLTYINQIKQQLKNEQNSLLRGHDDKVREVERNRDELENKLQKQISECVDMSSTKARLESKILNLSNDVASLQGKIDDKQNCIRVAEERIRSEVKTKLDELKDLKEEKMAMLDKQKQLQIKLEMEKKSIEETLKEREIEIISLNAKLNEMEKKILKIKEEETRRVGMLQSAFLQYIQPSTN